MDFPSMDTKSTSDFHLPPGFRFHPSDQELIVHYLKNKISSTPLPASVIAELNLYKYDPWDLPKRAVFGEEEWYFFTPRDRKYPKGARPNRTAASGYWKATGTDKPILTSCGTRSIGVKKALVFYKGRPPKGIKTDWIMHEFRLLDTLNWNPKTKGSMRLDDWVLCRVRQKTSLPKSIWEDQNDDSYGAAICYFPKEPSNEMVKNFLYNECPMLPYILASQDFSSPSTNFQDILSNKSTSDSAVHEDKNLQFNNLFNPLKRKHKSCIQSSNKILKRHNEIDKGTDVHFFATEQSDEGSNFNTPHWNSFMQFRDSDHFAFTGSE